MNIYSIKLNFANGVNPVYEVHSWDRVEEIITSTKKLTNEAFTYEVFGIVEERVA